MLNCVDHSVVYFQLYKQIKVYEGGGHLCHNDHISSSKCVCSLLEFYLTSRLLDVVHSQKKLYLVFEYMNQDLRKYLDSAHTGELPLGLVKVLSFIYTFIIY